MYSLRAKERPTVSTPVTWREVSEARKKGDPTILSFETQDVLSRIEKKGIFLNPSSRCGKSCLNLKEFRPSVDEYRRICDHRIEIVRLRSAASPIPSCFAGSLPAEEHPFHGFQAAKDGAEWVGLINLFDLK